MSPFPAAALAPPWTRPILLTGVALAVAAAPVPGRAAALAPADVDREVEVLAEQGKLREAAERAHQELTGSVETLDTRARRNNFAAQAVNLYKAAFEAAPGECALASSGLSLADEYLDTLLSVYGAPARNSDEYVGLSERRGELDRVREERGCPAPAPRAAPEPQTAPNPPPSQPEPAPKPAPPEDSRPRDGSGDSRRLVAGLAVSGALTGTMLAVSLGTGLSRYREPFRGAAYMKIYDAARASFADGDASNNVNYGSDTDMCKAAGSGDVVVNQEVFDACSDWKRLGTVAIATGIAAGVLGATTITLAALLVRDKRRSEATAALIRRHQAVLGAAPNLRGGMNLSLSFRF